MIRVIAGIVACLKVLAFAAPAASAVGESLDQLVAGGKREGEVTLIAWKPPSTKNMAFE